MASTLRAEEVASLLQQLQALADREDPQAKERVRVREVELGRRLTPVDRYELYGDAPLSVSPGV